MAEQPDQKVIDKLIEDLYSDEAYQRLSAVETIVGQKLKDERAINALKNVAGTDPNRFVKAAASDGLVALGVIPASDRPTAAPEPSSRPLPSSTTSSEPQASPAKNNWPFFIGFVGWFVVNLPIAYIWFSLLIGSALGHQDLSPIILMCPSILNLGVLVWLFATSRQYVAYGMLAAMGLALIVSLPFAGLYFLYYLIPIPFLF